MHNLSSPFFIFLFSIMSCLWMTFLPACSILPLLTSFPLSKATAKAKIQEGEQRPPLSGMDGMDGMDKKHPYHSYAQLYAQLYAQCLEMLHQTPKLKSSLKSFQDLCEQALLLKTCYSQEKRPIFHMEKQGQTKGRRILVIASIHGDEPESSSLAFQWLYRLQQFLPRNNWRIIPVSNPDGFLKRTRTNANGVDINRNFPSKNWQKTAIKLWKERYQAHPRRNPGPQGGSEPETQCIMAHLKDFQPDLSISIHTPLGVLDFDGPRLTFPPFRQLPWTSLGTFPGSLGRYLWIDRQKPVLTIELKAQLPPQLSHFDQLQDISGFIALSKKRWENLSRPTQKTKE